MTVDEDEARRRAWAPLITMFSNLIEGTDRVANRLHGKHGSLPVERSRLSAQLAEENDFPRGFPGRPVYDALGFGHLTLVQAQDHLLGVGRSVAQPPLGFSTRTVARSVVELTARAEWRLKAGIDVRERVRRHVNELLFSYWEAKQGGFEMKDGQSPNEHARKLTTWSESADYEPARQTRSGCWYIGDPRPGATRLVGDVHGELGRVAFKDMSASVHGTAHGGAVLVEPSDGAEFDCAGGFVTITIEEVTRQVLVALVLFTDSLVRIAEAYGWDHDVARSWRDHVRRKLRGVFEILGMAETS